MRLFVYGTLMCDDIMRMVCGNLPPFMPASLSGFRSVYVGGETYPALVADKDAVTVGRVYRNITQKQWRALDRFEGEQYVRKMVRVELEGGDTALVVTYLLHPKFTHCLDNRDWELQTFVEQHKAAFMRGLASGR